MVFISVILLPAVFLPEQDKDIRDLLSSKYMPIAKLYSIRIIQVLIYLMLLLGVYMYLLKLEIVRLLLEEYIWVSWQLWSF